MFEAIAIGPFLIWTRLVFLLIGIWLATEFFLRLATTANLSLQHFREHSYWYLGAFVLGARITAMIAEYRVYMRDPLRIFILWDGGFSFLGGAIGIALVLYYVTRAHRTTYLQWLDALLPATTLGLTFDWLGKFFAGRSYGNPTDVFWGISYDSFSVRFAVPIHPVQLYYTFFFFFLTFLLLIIRKNERRAGSETLWGIVIASLVTFFLEYFRGDFAIPVFATKMDFLVLILLFVGLGIFAALELKLSKRAMTIYEVCLLLVFGGYFVLPHQFAFPTIELRFSQFLAILALLATIVYVIVQRRKYPYL